jgi:DNA mismatch repair protein MutL
MNAEDAVVAFHRHATSKIREASDLIAIRSFGFRGEALPSMAAVARVELSTREETSIGGTQVIVQGGHIKSVEEIGRAVGTTVIVKHLFYNTPARRKFLKSTSTELRHITRAMVNTAIAYPAVGLALSHNERELFRWSKMENLKGRLRDIYGSQFLKEALPLVHTEKGIAITGWIGKPEAARSSRIHQFLFVNKRPIGSKLLHHAIYEGYGPRLSRGKHPMVILLLEVNHETLDVNVHPTKKEVRFADERLVHQALLTAIRKALGEKGAAPSWRPVSSRRDLRKEIAARFPFAEQTVRQDVRVPTPIKEGQGNTEDQLTVPLVGTTEGGNIGREKPREERMWPDIGTESEETVSLWQLHRRYILAQLKDGAVIIDQHAAHERVLYEKAKESFRGERGAGQQLLFPFTVELSFEELTVMAEAMPLFQQLGFDIKLFGGNTIVVEAVPAILGKGTGEQSIVEIVDALIDSGKGDVDISERMAISFACKTAIKDGDRLTQEEMNHLIDMLFATQNPFSCPHGRPTFIRMPLYELDRKFKR